MERPRDRLGRPLPRDADPASAVAGIDPAAVTSDDTAWRLAVAYLDRQRPFHAHEVFEERWRQVATPEREAWRALAQWCAALTHAARGNDVGARSLAARAEATLAAAPAVPAVIDLPRVRQSCRELAAL